jgi:hypothetical protein
MTDQHPLHVIDDAYTVSVGPFFSLPAARAYRDAHGGFVNPGPMANTRIVSPDGEIVTTADTTLSDVLSDAERTELTRLEAIITPKKDTFIEVGNALLTIRERKLYREFGTWETYCEQRWGFSRQQSDRLMYAAPLGALLSPVVTTEGAIRQLRVLKDPNDQKFAALLAVEIAKQAGIDQPTAHEFHAAAEAVQEMHHSGYVTLDDITAKPGEPMPAAVASGILRAMEVIQRQKAIIDGTSPYGRLENGRFEGCAGEVADWFADRLIELGGATEVRVIVYVKKAVTP